MYSYTLNRESRVVEVADTFVERPDSTATDKLTHQQSNKTIVDKYGGRVTAEEILDSIFQATTPVKGSADADQRSVRSLIRGSAISGITKAHC